MTGKATTPGVGKRVLGAPLPHESARAHVTGQAAFLDDAPLVRGELYVDVVGSPLAHGRISAIETVEAARIEGVVAVLTADDIPGAKTFGPVVDDEEVLAWDECHHVGQPMVLLAAESRASLRAAVSAVCISIEALPAEVRRHPYRITPAGVTALRAHLDAIERVRVAGRLRLGLGGI